jgi:hypothetical protein
LVNHECFVKLSSKKYPPVDAPAAVIRLSYRQRFCLIIYAANLNKVAEMACCQEQVFEILAPDSGFVVAL